MEKQIITQEQYQGSIGTVLQDIENLWVRMYVADYFENMELSGVLYRQIVVGSGGPS